MASFKNTVMSSRLPFLFISLLILGASFSMPGQAHAQVDHQLIRRVAVFPLKVPSDLTAAGEESWWQARDQLSRSRRFLVASQQFLVKSDAFQPRGDLEPADAVILGKLLDAHALATLQLQERRLVMTVYDGGTGMILWRKAVSLHPSLTVRDQLPQMARRIVDDFAASIPYQGFTVVDSLIGSPVYEEGDVKLAQVDLGVQTGSQIGDLVQWIRLTSTNAAPLFQQGSKMTVFAEGKIVKIEQGLATVEILRATGTKDIKEFSLVRVPREADRLAKEFTISDMPRTTLTAELVAPEASPMEELARERKPLVTTMSFIASVVGYLLLAF